MASRLSTTAFPRWVPAEGVEDPRHFDDVGLVVSMNGVELIGHQKSPRGSGDGVVPPRSR